jgi:lactoylglutathione lyase
MWMFRGFSVALLASYLAGCSVAHTEEPRTNSGLDHIALTVRDVGGTATFYKTAFGFTELKTPFAGGGGVVWLDMGNGTALHIFGGLKQPVADARERHIAITVADMTKVTDFLRSKGIAWQDFDGAANEVQTRPDGVRQMFFRDPDGYWVEVNDALKALGR